MRSLVLGLLVLFATAAPTWAASLYTIPCKAGPNGMEHECLQGVCPDMIRQIGRKQRDFNFSFREPSDHELNFICRTINNPKELICTLDNVRYNFLLLGHGEFTLEQFRNCRGLI